MRDRIADFLASKALSINSQKAYGYDLEQFCQLVDEPLTKAGILAYEAYLQTLKPAVSQRKQSAANQFLYFLYEMDVLDRYYKIKWTKPRKQIQAKPAAVLDLSVLWEPTEQVQGQLLALLIWQLGLTPSEILVLESSQVNLAFRVLTVTRQADKRVLELPEDLLPYLADQLGGVYLFDKKGKPYTRQWAFNQLKAYLTSLGLGELTAKSLRDQYILNQRQAGLSKGEVAKKLGLKQSQTLEQYDRSWTSN